MGNSLLLHSVMLATIMWAGCPAEVGAAKSTQSPSPPASETYPDPGEGRWWSRVDTQFSIEADRTGKIVKCEVLKPDFMIDKASAACRRLAPTKGFIDEIRRSGKRTLTDTSWAPIVIVAEIGDYREDLIKRLLAGDFRPVNYTHPGIHCIARPQTFENPIGLPAANAVNWQSRNRILADYARAYNQALISSPQYPYRDICTASPNAPDDPARLVEFLAAEKALDDGSLVAAVRLGDLNLVRQRTITSPGQLTSPDRSFGLTPLNWAVVKGHMDIANAILSETPKHKITRQAESALFYAINFLRRDFVKWVLKNFDPNLNSMIAQGYNLRLPVVENHIGFQTTKSIADHFLHRPNVDISLLIQISMNLTDDETTHPAKIASYVVHSPIIRERCRTVPTGWKPDCGLDFAIRHGNRDVADYVVNNFRPSPQQLTSLIIKTILNREVSPTSTMLRYPYDRQALLAHFKANPVGHKAMTQIRGVTLPEPYPETEAALKAREERTRQTVAAQEAAKAKKVEAIVDLLLRAGFTRSEIGAE